MIGYVQCTRICCTLNSNTEWKVTARTYGQRGLVIKPGTGGGTEANLHHLDNLKILDTSQHLLIGPPHNAIHLSVEVMADDPLYLPSPEDFEGSFLI
jgi:hypothetical protein